MNANRINYYRRAPESSNNKVNPRSGAGLKSGLDDLRICASYKKPLSPSFPVCQMRLIIPLWTADVKTMHIKHFLTEPDK